MPPFLEHPLLERERTLKRKSQYCSQYNSATNPFSGRQAEFLARKYLTEFQIAEYPLN